MDPMVAIRGLCKDFGTIRAVDDISFDVRKGEVLGFLGPNGAGKSTTMKMITGFLSPSAGSATICGHDVAAEPVKAKARIGYLPEGAPAYPDMTPASFLGFIADIRGIRGEQRGKRIDFVVERTQIRHVLHQPIETLSKGFKRRVGLAQAILHDPDVLVLDEPTDGLDPNQKHEVRGLISELAHDKATIISTHILEEVDAVCSRALIIAQGRIVADGTPRELESRSRWHNAVSMILPSAKVAALREALARVRNVVAIEDAVGEDNLSCVTAFTRPGASLVGELGAIGRDPALSIEEIRVERGRLDEVFRQVTTTSANPRAAA
ncbi:MAG: ABC transporter ATP-binding protein [Alphaproteobacteria bacterium]|nr:ABC transporter ATP-binding protein [Alphaproteobacteria bacterium]